MQSATEKEAKMHLVCNMFFICLQLYVQYQYYTTMHFPILQLNVLSTWQPQKEVTDGQVVRAGVSVK